MPDDLILLYYSGHGLQDEYDHLYLCAHDTRSNLLLSTAISDAEINSVMRSSAAKTFVVILDCCYSGAFKERRPTYEAVGRRALPHHEFPTCPAVR